MDSSVFVAAKTCLVIYSYQLLALAYLFYHFILAVHLMCSTTKCFQIFLSNFFTKFTEL